MHSKSHSKSHLLLSLLAGLQGKTPQEVWSDLYSEMCEGCYILHLNQVVPTFKPWKDFCKGVHLNKVLNFYYTGPDLYSDKDEVLAMLFRIADDAAKFRGRESVSCFPLWDEYRCMIDVPADIGASGPTRHAAIRAALEQLGSVG
jgi:hypothetical protein